MDIGEPVRPMKVPEPLVMPSFPMPARTPIEQPVEAPSRREAVPVGAPPHQRQRP